MDAFIAELIELNKPHLIAEAEKVRVNTILLNERAASDAEIPAGATKTGGYPDLPPSISYPTEFVKETEASMYFMAQINLREVSPYDRDGLLPKTGMLYFFWCGYLTGESKVIYYNGDADLTRTLPTLPYFNGSVFTKEPLETEEYCVSCFKTAYEYNLSGEKAPWNFDEQFEELDGLLAVADFQEDGTRLFGVPCGGNIGAPHKGSVNLLWLPCQIGCLWNIYWRIEKEDLARRNFDDVVYGYDID
ncbi:hypothetical protein AGMMS49975_24240 [Clostridia bacterium]|nr:hypothetical protein AGMMS49975_24240 [Clostridia bacterium]